MRISRRKFLLGSTAVLMLLFVRWVIVRQSLGDFVRVQFQNSNFNQIKSTIDEGSIHDEMQQIDFKIVVEDPLRFIQQKMSEDYRLGRISSISGWVLSHTEISVINFLTA